MKTAILSLVALIIMVAGIGCAAVSQLVTPATIDHQAVKYAVDANVASAGEFSGYGNLDKAIKLESAVNNAYESNTLKLTQLMEKNELRYSQLKGVTANNTRVALAKEEALFGPKGLISLAATALGFGTCTGLIGLFRKRPGDITKEEMETAVEEFKGEVTAKDRQIIEIVKGVQAFLNVHPKGDKGVGDELLTFLQKQSVDTRQAVALAKTTA